jgi:hypothetical protein
VILGVLLTVEKAVVFRDRPLVDAGGRICLGAKCSQDGNLSRDAEAQGAPYLGLVVQSQLFPHLHSLLSFMGQFLPVFLQFGLSAAKVVVQTAATRIESRIFV